MNRHLPVLVLVPILCLVLTAPSAAAPLDVVQVSAPDINCVFDADCRITVQDSTAPITLPAATGEGFLQSRTAPPGEPGTPGQGFVPYEYRVDLRQIAGLTALPCITELEVPFGPHQPLDFDGDGNQDDVFVVTGGGLGSVGLASADKTGGTITFRFEPAVCAGSSPGRGESTFFFGLAGGAPPQPVNARATVNLGGTLDLAARAPGGADGGAGGPGLAPGPCFPGALFPSDVPVCHCLRDRVLRELRCALLHPDFVLVRRTPLPIPPGDPFTVRWSFAPRDGFAGKVVVEDGLPPGFVAPRGPRQLVFRAAANQGGTTTREYRLATNRDRGTASLPSLVTVEPRGRRGEPTTFQAVLPIGPQPWPGLDDAPSEPAPRSPADPDFGDDRCGREAQRLWDEHVERFAGTPFGLSLAEHEELQERAERCRRAMPDYGLTLCGGAGQSAWVECFLRDGWACKQVGDRAVERGLGTGRIGRTGGALRRDPEGRPG